jgi:hypothetical protein
MIYRIKCFSKITGYYINMHFIINSTYDFVCKTEYQLRDFFSESKLFTYKDVVFNRSLTLLYIYFSNILVNAVRNEVGL